MQTRKWYSAPVLNVKVDFPNRKQVLQWVKEQVKYNKVGQITTPNPEQVVLAQKDLEFREVLNHSALSICDGVGLEWAAKLAQSCNAKVKTKRLSGVDLMIDLCHLAARKDWKVFLLGGKPGVAEAAAKQLDLRIKANSGTKNIGRETKEEKNAIISQINTFHPQLLFVAYGAPWQEKWIARNLPQLKVNVAMGVGGAFDYISGRVGRPPKLVRQIGLEWLWRLGRQPWRLKRQLSLLNFLGRVVKEKISYN